MLDFLLRISTNCIGLSYLLALVLELVRLRWPRPSLKVLAWVAGAAGLFAHSAYLATHRPNPATAFGASLSVSWVLAIFYVIGSLQHTRQLWAVFVLPIILALWGLAFFASTPTDIPPVDWATADRLWGIIHGVFVLLAAVGISIGCMASIMYLVQTRRLKLKKPLLSGLKMLSLERLEQMNRRAVNLAFPLLTIGLLLGVLLLRQTHDFTQHWFNVKVLGTAGLWATFLVLLYARYARHAAGRVLALLTILAFVLMLAVLFAAHPFAQGGGAS
jgi:ABC-type transport system involved in cytochrome c biogenesis permease subunit